MFALVFALTLAVTPRVCLSPCTVRIVVRVDPDPDHRWLIVELDGPLMFQGSKTQLEGDQAPKTQPAIWFKDIPPGHYAITAAVIGTLKERARVATTLDVS